MTPTNTNTLNNMYNKSKDYKLSFEEKIFNKITVNNITRWVTICRPITISVGQ